MPKVEIDFKAPKCIYDELEQIRKIMIEYVREYKDVYDSSFLKRLQRALPIAKKTLIKRQKEELQRKLESDKERINNIYLNYYDDSTIKKKCSKCFEFIDIMFKKCGIAVYNVKSSNNRTVGSSEIRININRLNFLLTKVQEECKQVLDLKLTHDQVEIKDKTAARYGIDCSDFKKESLSLKGIFDKANKFCDLAKETNTQMQVLIKDCKGKKDWNEILKSSNGLLDATEIRFKNYKEVLNRSSGCEKFDVQKVKDKFKKIEADLERKIKFAESLESFVIFDSNMGVEIEYSREDLKCLKKTKWGEYINFPSPYCAPIARGEKHFDKAQYNHNKVLEVLNKGPHYILVDQNNITVKDAHGTGVETINSSWSSPDAEKEVETYLQESLKAGKWI